MFSYLIKVGIKPYKSDEFVASLMSIAPKMRKGKDCIGYSLYSNCNDEHGYMIVGEWKTKQALENHFKTNDFKVLVGAARVLGEDFEIKISEGLETGGIELAKARISAP